MLVQGFKKKALYLNIKTPEIEKFGLRKGYDFIFIFYQNVNT